MRASLRQHASHAKRSGDKRGGSPYHGHRAPDRKRYRRGRMAKTDTRALIFIRDRQKMAPELTLVWHEQRDLKPLHVIHGLASCSKKRHQSIPPCAGCIGCDLITRLNSLSSIGRTTASDARMIPTLSRARFVPCTHALLSSLSPQRARDLTARDQAKTCPEARYQELRAR